MGTAQRTIRITNHASPRSDSEGYGCGDEGEGGGSSGDLAHDEVGATEVPD